MFQSMPNFKVLKLLMTEKKTRQKTIHATHDVKEKIIQLYDELFRHNGYGEMRVEMRFLRRGEKEIIVHCGKEYRFVVEYQGME